MSDFGAIIGITKKDNSDFSEAEFNEIKGIIENYKTGCTYTNSISEPFLFGVGKTQKLNDPSFYEVNILLSDYYGDRKMYDWHKDIDLKYGKIVTDDLKKLVPENYVLALAFEWW